MVHCRISFLCFVEVGRPCLLVDLEVCRLGLEVDLCSLVVGLLMDHLVVGLFDLVEVRLILVVVLYLEVVHFDLVEVLYFLEVVHLLHLAFSPHFHSSFIMHQLLTQPPARRHQPLLLKYLGLFEAP